MSNSIKISASLMCCDQLNLKKEILSLIKAGCDSFHIDIMDGTFVDNFAMSISSIIHVRKVTNLFIDVHLMINYPEKYLYKIKEAGASRIMIHLNSCRDLMSTLKQAKKLSLRTGLVLEPTANIKIFNKAILKYIDCFLVMAVNPGFSGQKFIPETINKIIKLKHLLISLKKEEIEIYVDGAISKYNVKALYNAGAIGFVAGTAGLFNRGIKYKSCINQLRMAI